MIILRDTDSYDFNFFVVDCTEDELKAKVQSMAPIDGNNAEEYCNDGFEVVNQAYVDNAKVKNAHALDELWISNLITLDDFAEYLNATNGDEDIFKKMGV